MSDKMDRKIVWEFTNKRELNAAEFVLYFEKKVKGTIRKYQMPIAKVNGNSLKAKIINQITRGLVKRKGRISADNLNSISNNIIYTLMHKDIAKLTDFLPRNQPLYFLSDKEILLYAKIKKINGEINSVDKKLQGINNFLEKLEQKNQDIRHNIANALLSYTLR